MKWFKDCKTYEDVKKAYKKLALQYHPDVSKEDTTEIMAQINAEYDKVAHLLKNKHRNAKGEFYEKESAGTPEEFRDIINRIITFVGVDIEVCGSWLWVSGNTKSYKDILKELKFKWSSNKSAWYFHNEPYRKKTKKLMTLDEIRDAYGSEKVQTERRNKLELAPI